MTETPSAYIVLIETLWNVKYTAKFRGLRKNNVLIETLWNVKQERSECIV